ncbi:hypothetical protein GCM10027449_24330 [Sinomonas notoginsengisoli]|uniref:hypothetical protein n=1 Tax=Sinomonas notoginsengisoli TaxID=1457311 RepID=UPI001F1A4B6D|nr:hypothetical protein [Sinomonas notoginsengisoli]
MTAIMDLLAMRGGSARTQLLRRSFSKRQIARAVADGTIIRSVRGVYALASLGEAEHTALESSGVLCLRSAALAHGMGVLHRPKVVELAVPRERRAIKRSGVSTRRRLLPAQDLVRQGEVFATSAARTVLDCAAALPFAEGLAIADSGLRMGLVSRDELVSAAAIWVGRNRSAQQRVLEHMDGRAANAFESGLRAACIEAGVPMKPQVVIRAGGTDRRVDLARTLSRGSRWVWLVAEADSFEWHGGRQALHRDCTRYNELVRAGCALLRFSWEHVMFEREWIGEVVADVADRPARGNSPPEPRFSRLHTA